MARLPIFIRIALSSILLFFGTSPVADVSAQQWETVAPMNVARAEVLSVTLLDGRILVAGGRTANNTAIKQTEIYDPVQDTWTLVGDLNTARYRGSIEILSTGKVVVSGGLTGPLATTATREIFDPATNTWTLTTSMLTPRQNFPSVVLPNGRIVCAGGMNSNPPVTYLKSVEYYDPVTASVGWMPDMPLAFYGNIMRYSVALDALVATAGLLGGSSGTYQKETLIYSFATGTWTYGGQLSVPHSNPRGQDIQLKNGAILEVSGRTGQTTVTTLIERFDESNRNWTSIGNLRRAHWHTKTLQLGDSLLVVGGLDDPDVYVNKLTDCSWYDLKTNTSSAAPSLNIERAYHGAHEISLNKSPCFVGPFVLAFGGETKAGVTASTEVLRLKPLPVVPLQLAYTKFLRGLSCNALQEFFTLSNPNCAAAEILSTALVTSNPSGLDVSFASLSNSISVKDSGRLELEVQGGPGQYYLDLRVKYRLGGRVIDTVFRVSITFDPPPDLPLSLRYDGVVVGLSCDTLNGDPLLINPNCDSIKILSTVIEGISPDSLLTWISPSRSGLPGQDSTFLNLRVKGRPGVYYGAIRLRYTRQGSVRDTLMNVTIILRAPPPLPPVPTFTPFSAVTFCDTATSVLKLRVPACREFLLERVEWLPEDQGYMPETLDLPVRLSGGVSYQFLIRYYNPVGIARKDTVRIVGKVITADQTVPYDTLLVINPPPLSGRSKLPTLEVEKFSSVASCDSQSRPVRVTNVDCRRLILTSADILPTNSLFKLISGVIPDTLNSSETWSGRILFDPSSVTGQFYDTLVLRGYMETASGPVPFDSVVILGGESTPSNASITQSLYYLDYRIISTCESRDSTIVLTNHGCGDLLVNKITVSGAYFTSATMSTPVLLPSRGSMPFVVSYAPRGVGTHSGNIECEVEYQGLRRTIAIPLQGTGRLPEVSTVVVPSEVDFDSISICLSTDTTIQVRNTGCDSIYLETALAGDPAFELVTQRSLWLAPGEATEVVVKINPVSIGLVQGVLRTSFQDRFGNIVTRTVNLRTLIGNGDRLLTSSLSEVDFGMTSLCEERDTTLVLRNTGCDTVWITTLMVPSWLLVKSSSLPIRLAPGEQCTLDVRTIVDTTGSPVAQQGSLGFQGNMDTPLRPVQFRKGLVYPRKVQFTLDGPPSAGFGDTVTFTVNSASLQSVVHVAGELLLNTDLLSPIEPLTGRVISRTYEGGGQERLLFEIRPPYGDTLLSVPCVVRLAPESEASIQLLNISLSGLEPAFERCVASALGTSTIFKYDPSCGDTKIREVLSRSTASPKFQFGDGTIGIRVFQDGPASAYIYDILGKCVLEQHVQSSNGEIRIRSNGLSPGIYLVRLSSGGQNASRMFIRP